MEPAINTISIIDRIKAKHNAAQISQANQLTPEKIHELLENTPNLNLPSYKLVELSENIAQWFGIESKNDQNKVQELDFGQKSKRVAKLKSTNNIAILKHIEDHHSKVQSSPYAKYYGWLSRVCNESVLTLSDSDGYDDALKLVDIFIQMDGFHYQTANEKQRHSIFSYIESTKRLVVLGDKGSGKSSLIRFIGYHLSSDAKKNPLPYELRQSVPVYFDLRACHEFDFSAKGHARLIWSLLEQQLVSVFIEETIEQVLPLIRQAVFKEGVTFLFDGFDELPQEQKCLLEKAINELTLVLWDTRCQFIITSRTDGCNLASWRGIGYQIVYLNRFNHDQIQTYMERFIHFKNNRAKGESSHRLIEYSEVLKLMQAMVRYQALEHLAAYPLFIAQLAVMNNQGLALPQERIYYYEQCFKLQVESFIHHSKDHVLGSLINFDSSIQSCAQADNMNLLDALAKLAFDLYLRNANGMPLEIHKGQLIEALTPFLSTTSLDKLWHNLFVELALLKTAHQGTIKFRFTAILHYLTARFLVDKPQMLANLVRNNNQHWREIFLLAIVLIKRASVSYALSVINELLPFNVESVENPTLADWRSAITAGRALVSMDGKQLQSVSEVARITDKKIVSWLLLLVKKQNLDPIERSEVGELLAILGDQRPGVSCVIKQGQQFPGISWVKIPAGSCVIGSQTSDKHAEDCEKPSHSQYVKDYLISRYPITNAQYAAFVDQDGYHQKDYWHAHGWRWLTSQRIFLPKYWHQPKWNQPNYPVVGVSWFEAQAFCSWLTHKLQALNLIKPGQKVVLPSEAQWEKAARGDTQRRYPWGDNWQPHAANGGATQINQTTAVGLFEEYKSVYGVSDMSGNVWEWVADDWHTNYRGAPHDGGVWNDNDELNKVLRGGSWLCMAKWLRCSTRYWDKAHVQDQEIGFRVVLMGA